MNRERAKELLPIMQAYVDGKEVQYFSVSDNWVTTYTPMFYSSNKYRIKPEPREFWLIEHQDGSISFFKPGAAPIGASKFIEDLSDEC